MNEDILDIFYNSIIPEASRGTIDCFMYYNICFNTSIEGQTIKGNNPSYVDPPLLEIRDKKEFDDILKEYIDLALEFYDDEYFYDEVLSGEYRTKTNKLCKEKVIMSLVWSNAVLEDFSDPVNFLRRQKAYLENNPLMVATSKGYSDILGGRIVTAVTKTGKISWESPYAFRSAIATKDDAHDLPVLRFGIDNDTIYIYSIQQRKKARKDKRINRNLYKVNENFVTDDFNEDLKNITPSSLVALYLFLLHFNNLGYTKFKLVPYLPIRWIDKKITINKKAKKVLEKSKEYKEGMEELLRNQDNITQKFITTFRRLNYHVNDNLKINSFPMEMDSYLSFECDDLSKANNPLFQELSYLYNNQKKTK